MNASNIDPFTLPSLSLNKVLANLTVQLPKRVVQSKGVLCIGKIVSLAHFQGYVSKAKNLQPKIITHYSTSDILAVRSL